MSELNGTRTNIPVRISPSTIEPAMTNNFRSGISKVSLTWNFGMACEVVKRKASATRRRFRSGMETKRNRRVRFHLLGRHTQTFLRNLVPNNKSIAIAPSTRTLGSGTGAMPNSPMAKPLGEPLGAEMVMEPSETPGVVS